MLLKNFSKGLAAESRAYPLELGLPFIGGLVSKKVRDLQERRSWPVELLGRQTVKTRRREKRGRRIRRWTEQS